MRLFDILVPDLLTILTSVSYYDLPASTSLVSFCPRPSTSRTLFAPSRHVMTFVADFDMSRRLFLPEGYSEGNCEKEFGRVVRELGYRRSE